MTPDQDALSLLKSIDTTLKRLVSILSQSGGASTAGSPARTIASDKDLDSQYGDPVVRMKDPRDWTGPIMKGRKFSECPPEYLDQIADRFDYFADKADDEGEKLDNGKAASHYKRIDSARARGWAARIRSGRHKQRAEPAAAPASSGWGAAERWSDRAPEEPKNLEPLTDDDIPFSWLLPLLALAPIAHLFAG